jgi:hypothetical protein
MGTRGLFGFYYKGKYYLIYNHFDSYPSGLGQNLINEIINALKNNLLDDWIQMLIKCKVVTEDINPTQEDIAKLSAYTVLSVSSQSTSDWYCLTRNIQGSFISALESGYIYTNKLYENKLIGDIFIEYSYVLDFDNMLFKIYTSDGLNYQINVDKLNPDNLEKNWEDALKKILG